MSNNSRRSSRSNNQQSSQDEWDSNYREWFNTLVPGMYERDEEDVRVFRLPPSVGAHGDPVAVLDGSVSTIDDGSKVDDNAELLPDSEKKAKETESKKGGKRKEDGDVLRKIFKKKDDDDDAGSSATSKGCKRTLRRRN